jgi:hypothetical protein
LHRLLPNVEELQPSTSGKTCPSSAKRKQLFRTQLIPKPHRRVSSLNKKGEKEKGKKKKYTYGILSPEVEEVLGEFDDDFRISVTFELKAAGNQHLFQRGVVRDDAVVDDNKLVFGRSRGVRVRISSRRGSMSSPSKTQ